MSTQKLDRAILTLADVYDGSSPFSVTLNDLKWLSNFFVSWIVTCLRPTILVNYCYRIYLLLEATTTKST